MPEYLITIHNRWYPDSSCSRHMTGDKTKFCLLTESEGGQVTFKENSKGKIIGSGKVGKNLSSHIDDVILVEGLAYNLLSISQLCDKIKFFLLKESEGGQVTFGENSKGKIIGSGKVDKNLSSCIDDVMLVEGLAYNLLSISQMCDKGHKVLFDSEACTIF